MPPLVLDRLCFQMCDIKSLFDEIKPVIVHILYFLHCKRLCKPYQGSHDWIYITSAEQEI